MIIVTHGGFLHYFTEDFEGAINDGTVGTGWSNTEYRTYNFDEEIEGIVTVEGNDRAPITETQDSRTRRSRDMKPLTREEQIHLKATVEFQWSKDGFQNTGGWTTDDAAKEGEEKDAKL